MTDTISYSLFESLLNIEDVRGLHCLVQDIVRERDVSGFEVSWRAGDEEQTIVRVGDAGSATLLEPATGVGESDGWWAFALSDEGQPAGWMRVKLAGAPTSEMITWLQQLSRWMRPVARRLAERANFRRIEHKLELLREQTEKSERLKEEFLSNLSHELRTPLTAILGFSEILRDRSELALRDAECVDRIHDNGERLLRLLNRLIQLAKLESDRTNLNLRKCLPHEVIDFAADPLRPLAEAKSLVLRTEFEELAAEYLDDGLLREAIQCVLENAIKFTEKGEVRIRGWADAQRLHVDISDTGKGIAQEQLSKVFDAFWQGDGSMTRAVGGNGIGLTLAHRLLRRMGGDIMLRSEPGSGTTVAMWLPHRMSQDRRLRRSGDDPIEQYGLPFQSRFQGPLIPDSSERCDRDLEA